MSLIFKLNKHRFGIFLCGLFLTCWPNLAWALVAIPPLTQPIVDEAQFIEDGEKPQIDQKIRALYESGGPQIVVWTLPSLDGEDIAALAIRAAETWKVGHAKKDDGLILVVARAERRTRLEVGYGLEGVLPDIVANHFLQNYIRPALRANRLGDGVVSLIDAVDKLTHDPGEAQRVTSEASAQTSPHGRPISGLFFILLIIIIVIINSLKSRFSPYGTSRGIWFGGGGSSRGGGSSWSGGGGSFGGGGSSGDW